MKTKVWDALKKVVARWEFVLVIAFILQTIVFGSMNPRCLNINILLGSFKDFASICMISLFVTFVMITGGIDIQAGSIVGLTSIVLGILWKSAGMNLWLVVLLVIVMGALCGMLSGYFIAYTGVQAMVVTLGGSFLYSGLAIVVAGLGTASAYEGISGYPEGFVQIAHGTILQLGSIKIPNLFLIFIVMAVIAYLLLHKTKYGRRVFLVGVNPNAAIYSGVNIQRVTMSTYVLSGISAAIAGVLLTSYLGSSRADLGSEYTLPIITAVVLGGTSSTGGRGNVIGTAIASLLIGILRFDLQMVQVPTQYLNIPVGILLILAVAIRALNGTLNIPGIHAIKDKLTRQKQQSSKPM